MRIEYDPAKNERNIKERGLPFSLAARLEWETAIIWQDKRIDYGENRWNALAFLDDRLCFICFKYLEYGIRVISFRKANSREVKKYERIQNT